MFGKIFGFHRPKASFVRSDTTGVLQNDERFHRPKASVVRSDASRTDVTRSQKFHRPKASVVRSDIIWR